MTDPKPLTANGIAALVIVALTLIIMCGLASWAWVATHR